MRMSGRQGESVLKSAVGGFGFDAGDEASAVELVFDPLEQPLPVHRVAQPRQPDLALGLQRRIAASASG